VVKCLEVRAVHRVKINVKKIGDLVWCLVESGCHNRRDPLFNYCHQFKGSYTLIKLPPGYHTKGTSRVIYKTARRAFHESLKRPLCVFYGVILTIFSVSILQSSYTRTIEYFIIRSALEIDFNLCEFGLIAEVLLVG